MTSDTSKWYSQGMGAITWFSITNAHVSRDDLKQWFTDLGIPESYLPPDISPLNAFRKATGPNVRFEYPANWLAGDQRMRVLIRDVALTSELVERHIIRETVDASGKSLSYNKIGEAVFYRATATTAARVDISIDPTGMQGREESLLHGFVASIEAEYDMLSHYYGSDAIRAIVRNFTLGLNAIMAKPSGGVYFVHKNKLGIAQDGSVTGINEVAKIETLVERVGGGSVYHTLPLIDDLSQRKMLTDAFQTQVEGEAEDLLKRIADMNASGKIRPQEYERMLNAYTDVLARSEEHTQLLGLSQERAGVALEMLMEAVMKLGDRVGELEVSK